MAGSVVLILTDYLSRFAALLVLLVRRQLHLEKPRRFGPVCHVFLRLLDLEVQGLISSLIAALRAVRLLEWLLASHVFVVILHEGAHLWLGYLGVLNVLLQFERQLSALVSPARYHIYDEVPTVLVALLRGLPLHPVEFS